MRIVKSLGQFVVCYQRPTSPGANTNARVKTGVVRDR
jgi:hypothetical protein